MPERPESSAGSVVISPIFLVNMTCFEVETYGLGKVGILVMDFFLAQRAWGFEILSQWKVLINNF